MPRGVYKRTTTAATSEADRVRTQIAELQARLVVLQEREKHSATVLALCRKHDLTRADLKRMIEQLPLSRITRKHREKMAARKNGAQHAQT